MVSGFFLTVISNIYLRIQILTYSNFLGHFEPHTVFQTQPFTMCSSPAYRVPKFIKETSKLRVCRFNVS